MTAAATAPMWCCQKIYLLTNKVGKISFEWKKVFFLAFSHFNNFFVTQGQIPAISNFLDLILPELSHNQSLQYSKTYLQSLKAKTETHFIIWSCSFWAKDEIFKSFRIYNALKLCNKVYFMTGYVSLAIWACGRRKGRWAWRWVFWPEKYYSKKVSNYYNTKFGTGSASDKIDLYILKIIITPSKYTNTLI